MVSDGQVRRAQHRAAAADTRASKARERAAREEERTARAQRRGAGRGRGHVPVPDDAAAHPAFEGEAFVDTGALPDYEPRHLLAERDPLAAMGAPPARLEGSAVDELREHCAAAAHESWASWMAHLLDERGRATLDGGVYLPAHEVEHWRRQIATPYAELTAREQFSDLEQVDRYWPAVVGFVARYAR